MKRLIFVLFLKIDLCSAILFKRSRQELSIDVAEHWSTLKSKGVVGIMAIFQDRHVQPYNSKGLGESFLLMWLNVGLS